MQTFSYMRRDSSYQANLKRVLLFAALLVYESITSIYTYLTPLYGFFFVYLIFNIEKKQKILIVTLLFLYMIFFEADKGFFLFSSIIFFAFFYLIAVENIIKLFHCKKCILTIFVVSGYIGIYLFNVFLSIIFETELPQFGIEYLIYMIIDSLIAFMVF